MKSSSTATYDGLGRPAPECHVGTKLADVGRKVEHRLRPDLVDERRIEPTHLVRRETRPRMISPSGIARGVRIA